MLSRGLHRLREQFGRHDSALWRRAVDFGVHYGSDGFVRHSPGLIGLLFALMPGPRATVRDNLRLALGGADGLREDLDVARTFKNFAHCLAESFVAGSGRGDRVAGLCKNDHHFVDAKSDGRGVIVTTAHTGGWQAAGAILRSVHDSDVLVVMHHERDARAAAVQDAAIDRAGLTVARLGDDPIDALPILAHLRKKGVVAVQIDRLPPGMRGRGVTLFGRPWRVPDGPLVLAALSGAPVVPAFSRRVAYMEYEIQLAPPVRLPRRPSSAELDAAAQTVADALEQFVKSYPTQWFHFGGPGGAWPGAGP